MVFSPPLGEAPRQAERRFRGSWPEGAASAPGRARGRCLWPPPGDFERLSRSWTEWGGPGEHSRGPAPGPTANFCLPACLPPPFHPVGGTVKPPSPLAIAEPRVASEN
uniref:Uncharacterized protein n=1 Tax=Rhinopithecus roxellana TaxID=61622 RepID=A0A2K6RP89_RHIRO